MFFVQVQNGPILVRYVVTHPSDHCTTYSTESVYSLSEQQSTYHLATSRLLSQVHACFCLLTTAHGKLSLKSKKQTVKSGRVPNQLAGDDGLNPGGDMIFFHVILLGTHFKAQHLAHYIRIYVI